ncbi:hypothetical protein GCM10029976_100050 [Kribbella albertanoniae]
MDEQDHGYALTGDALLRRRLQRQTVRTCLTVSRQAVSRWNVKTVVFSAAATLKTPIQPDSATVAGAFLLNLKGYDYPDIQRAVLAEKADAPLIQWDATSATLKALGCHNIDRVLLA